MAWVSVFDDTFIRANTTAGGANTTTGLAGDGNWTDVHGGVASIFSNLAQLVSSSTNWQTDFVKRPSSERHADQRAVLTWNGSQGDNHFAWVHRWDGGNLGSSGSAFLGFLHGTVTSGTCVFRAFKIVAGAVTELGASPINLTGFNTSDDYTIDTQLTGSSPATWRVIITDITTATVKYDSNSFGNFTATDTQLTGTGDMALDTAGGSGVTGWIKEFHSYFQSTATISASPSTIYKGTTGNTVNITGVGTAFSGTPFTISGGSITGTSITDGTHATLTITAPGSTGSVTITDTVSGATCTLTIAQQTMSVSPSSVLAGATALALTLTGVGTQWTAGTPGSPAFTVSAGTKTAQTVTANTSAGLTYNAPGSAGSVTITDPGTGATATLTISAAPATDFTVTPNPISGTPSAPTANITVTMNGTLASSESIALSDGGGGGTFTPSGLAFTTSDISKTFTYTPSAGSGGTSKTLTATGTGAFSAAHSITCNVSTGPVVVPVTDTNWFFSPYSWYINGGHAAALGPGPYFKIGFTGTSAVLGLQISQNGGNQPKVRWSIDNGSWQYALISSTTLTLATGLSAGNHTIDFQFMAANGGSGWATPNNSIEITSLTLDASANTVARSDIKPKRLVLYGDSITQGVVATNGGSAGTSGDDALLSFAVPFAAALNAESGQLGYTGQGYTFAAAGGAGAPPLFTPGNASNSSWDKYFASTTRLVSGLYSPSPDYVATFMGHNDHSVSSATVAASVQGWLNAVRAAAPSAWIFVFIDFSELTTTGITNGFFAYQAATPDAKAVLLNTGTGALFNLNGTATEGTVDGVHPFYQLDGVLGAQAASLAQAAISSTGGGGSLRLTDFSGGFPK